MLSKSDLKSNRVDFAFAELTLLHKIEDALRDSREFLLKEKQRRFCNCGSNEVWVYRNPNALVIDNFLNQLDNLRNRNES